MHGGCASSSAQPKGGESPEASTVTPDASGGTASGDASTTFSLTWSVALSVNPGTGFGDGSVGVVDAGDGGSRLEPIEGVNVCAMGHSEIPCAMTASDGSFTISGLVLGQHTVLTFEKTGYISLIRPIVMGKMDQLDTVPVLMARTSDTEPDLGVPIDTSTFGSVQFFLVAVAGAIPNTGAVDLYGLSDVPGVKVSMSPASGVGPYYTDTSNGIAFDAGSTVGFDALYFNVAPGDYTISVDDPNDNCAALSFTYASAGYPVLTTPHTVAFPVIAGYTDSVGVLCTRNARIVNVDGG